MKSISFIDLPINILNKIEFKIYNPKLNLILDKANKKFYILSVIYNFTSIDILELFNDIPLDYYKNNYLNKIKYMIKIEKIVLLLSNKISI